MTARIVASIVALAALCFFALTLYQALFYSPNGDTGTGIGTGTAQITGTSTAENYPVRLTIPSLSIDANVQHVGLTARGTMSAPNNFTDVGWYKYGSLPGAYGNTVMAGHVDNALALPGVFKHLADISVGADVFAKTKKGESIHFIVDSVETYTVSDTPSQKIFRTSGPPYLVLITCGGTWIQAQKQYDKRVVVYAHLAPQAAPFKKT